MDKTPASTSRETTIMAVWPSVATFKLGRLLGQLYAFGPRVSLLGVPLRPGWLIALAALPLSVLLYAMKISPRVLVVIGPSNPFCRRYRLTTERVLIEHPFDALSKSRSERATQASVKLEEFDAIDKDDQPGYDWYRADDLVFRREGEEVLRLAAVPHAEAFRQTCLKARQGLLGVQRSREATTPPPVAQGEG